MRTVRAPIAVLYCACAISASTAITAAFAADSAAEYPNKPTRILVGQSPGGATDLVARALAHKLSESLAQTIVVENRSGAAGSIAAALVAKSAPDGYTALVVPSSYTINPNLYRQLPFDPAKDLVPVTLIASAPYILMVHPSLPARTVHELEQNGPAT